MRVLVIGSGGREHALCWKLGQEAEVLCAPGNAGIAETCEVEKVAPEDSEAVVELAKRRDVDLVVIGPEGPLIAGLADELRSAGIAAFGPGGDGAVLEGSKAFSKRMMIEAGVPTPEYGGFTCVDDATSFAAKMFDSGKSVAVKASGAALGKGVAICHTLEEARAALQATMVDRVFGAAGETVVVEECLYGKEFSLMTLVSGDSSWSLPVAQDYKRAYDGDRGPNTGGMGAYSPVDWLSNGLMHETEERVVAPMLAAIKQRGIDFRGVLFSGLMVSEGRPFCLEYNVRFGDPETQTVLRRLGSGFAEALRAVAAGEPVPEVEVLQDAAITVVMASEGYPGKYSKGKKLLVPSELPDEVVVFHAGTSMLMHDVVTSGGRVLGVSATGADLESARATAYRAVEDIQFAGRQYRTDIGA